MPKALRPPNLCSGYSLEAPSQIYMTGELDSADRADQVKRIIEEYAFENGMGLPVLLDPDLRPDHIPSARQKSLSRQMYEKHRRELMNGVPIDDGGVIIIGSEEQRKTTTISQEMTYMLGKLSTNPNIEVCYFGKERELGALASTGRITVIQNPLAVFRWQHPEGAFQRVTSY